VSRSGYHDDLDPWDLIRWRGAVVSAIRGERGQSFLREMLAALDAIPDKRLIAHELVVKDGVQPDTNGCCALGAVALCRNLDVTDVDPEDGETVAHVFGIAKAMAREVLYENDEGGRYNETPEQRWTRMRAWVVAQIRGGE